MITTNTIFAVALAASLLGCQQQNEGTTKLKESGPVKFVASATGEIVYHESIPESAEAETVQAVTTSTGEMFYLEPDVLEREMRLAKQGDIQAAMRVADHYVLGLNKGDMRNSLPWLAIAAEKGDIVAMQNIAISLSTLGGKENCQAALDWLERTKREKSIEEVKEFGIDDSIVELKANFEDCVKHLR